MFPNDDKVFPLEERISSNFSVKMEPDDGKRCTRILGAKTAHGSWFKEGKGKNIRFSIKRLISLTSLEPRSLKLSRRKTED